MPVYSPDFDQQSLHSEGEAPSDLQVAMQVCQTASQSLKSALILMQTFFLPAQQLMHLLTGVSSSCFCSSAVEMAENEKMKNDRIMTKHTTGENIFNRCTEAPPLNSGSIPLKFTTGKKPCPPILPAVHCAGGRCCFPAEGKLVPENKKAVNKMIFSGVEASNS